MMMTSVLRGCLMVIVPSVVAAQPFSAAPELLPERGSFLLETASRATAQELSTGQRASLVSVTGRKPGPFFLILENEKWGLIDQTGQVVVPPRYDDLGEDHQSNPFGFAGIRLSYMEVLFLALLKFMWVRNWLKGLQEAQ